MSSELEQDCSTEFPSYSCRTYEWKISNVNCRVDKPETLTCPETIKSPPGKFPVTEWRLEALGERAVHEYFGQTTQPNCLTVRLTLISASQNTVWARVQLQTKGRPYSGSSQKYDLRPVQVSPHSNPPHTVRIWNGFGFTGYLPFSNINGDELTINHEYLYNGDLVIVCDITVTHLDNPVHATRTSTQVETLKVASFDLPRMMDDARQRDRYTDVTIVTKEKEFKAHKVVLACQSAFFETCLEERWKKEGDSGRIEMLDVPVDIMDAILTYIYTGKVNDIDKTAYDLLPKANEYQLEGLKATCEEALIKALTSQTVIDILLMADTHNAQNLRESCMLFIAKNIVDVKKSSAWTEDKLKNTNKDLLTEVLEHVVKLL